MLLQPLHPGGSPQAASQPRGQRVKTMNRKVTDVRSSANDIQTEAEALRDEVRVSLAIVEDALRSAVPPKKAAVSVAGD